MNPFPFLICNILHRGRSDGFLESIFGVCVCVRVGVCPGITDF